MQTDMTPISTFADLMTCILPWTYSALSPNEVPISLATRTASDFSTPGLEPGEEAIGHSLK